MPRKPRAEGTRAPNGAATVYLAADGRWHGRVTMGTRDDGSPDRRHVSAKSEGAVLGKVRGLEKAREAGRVVRAGRGWTVATWLTHWVETIAAPAVRDNTLAGYRVAVNKHLIPGLGAHRLDRLQAEHLERLYQKMISTGSAPATAHQVHRTLRAALNEAERRGHLARNPALLAKAPRLTDEEIEPYTVREIQRLMAAARDRRNSARWAIALALGLRQGETLGLKWADVDLDAGTLTVRRGRQRPRWRHGCDPACGRKFGGYCPDRIPARPDTADTKSRAGRRGRGSRINWSLYYANTRPSRPPRKSKPRTCGAKAGGCSPRPRVNRSTHALTTTTGSGYSSSRIFVTGGCTMLGTPQRLCC